MMTTPKIVRGIALLLVACSGCLAAVKPGQSLEGKSLRQLTAILTNNDNEVVRLNAVKAIAAEVPEKKRGTTRPPRQTPEYASPDKRVVEVLVRGLGDEASSVRYACREALGRCGAAAIGPLVGALASGNIDVRSYAADALGDMGVYDDADALGDMGAYDDSSALPLDKAVRALTKALGDEHYAVRVSAAMALSRIGVRAAPALPKLIALLDDAEWAVADAAVRAVAAADPNGKQCVPALVKVLGNKTHDLREFVCVELADMGPKAEAAIPALIELLDTDRNSWQAGKAAAGALASIVSIDPKNADAPVVSGETRTIVLAAIAKSAADPRKAPFVQDGRLYALLPRLNRTYGPGYTGPLGAEVLPALPLALSRLRSWSIPYHHWVPRRELIAFLVEMAPHAKGGIATVVKALLAEKDLNENVRKDLDGLLKKLES